MKLNNSYLQVLTNQHGEISQVLFNNYSVLHDGKQDWNKIYPMVFPVIGFSTGFQVEGKNYILPKHGFWKDLPWVGEQNSQKITFQASTQKINNYPFSLLIKQTISLYEQTLIVETEFFNQSSNDAYFHFGHHPAFKIDSISTLNLVQGKVKQINFQGQLINQNVILKPLTQMAFGHDYDTLVIKNWSGVIELCNLAFKVKVKSQDFSSLQIWKPQQANFICLEPWQGNNDLEANSSAVAKLKPGIVVLKPQASKTFTVKYCFSN